MARLARLLANFLVVSAGLVASPSQAWAFCQTTLCDGGVSGVRCSPAQSGDCGTPLRWPQKCIGYSLQERASAKVDYPTLAPIVAKAFAAWTNASCDGNPAGVASFDLGPVACDQKEYNLVGGNANVIFFHDDEWPYAGAGNTLALTTLTFNLDDASILDADLEVNGTVDLTTSDGSVQFDLQSILTHEAGHMLGIAHSAQAQTTMYIQYGPGDTSLRTLHPDDAAAICASYPPADTSSCDPTPRRGLATTCDAPPSAEDEGGCSCRTPARSATSPVTAPLVLAVALGLVTTRRRRATQRGILR